MTAMLRRWLARLLRFDEDPCVDLGDGVWPVLPGEDFPYPDDDHVVGA